MKKVSLENKKSVFQPILFVAVFQILSLPQTVEAVLPPDLVVSVGSQIAGFFSLLVAVVVSVFASLGVLYAGWFERFKHYSTYIAFGILVLALLASNAFYLWQLNQPSHVVAPEYPTFTTATTTQDCTNCAFYSDSLTLYVPDSSNPLVIELDLNRRQELDGLFTHYYFLNGTVGKNFDEYTQFSSNVYDLQPNDFLNSIQRIEAEDASVRDIYTGVVETQAGELITFESEAVDGDFITRNKPEYTQFQSATTFNVMVNGETKTAFGLVENLQSTDYRKRIFFPGMALLESLTHQFVLWDEAGAFYMIDDSKVFSNTPAYPAHSWLLYKSAVDGTTKKGFLTQITQLDESSWQVTVPDFQNGIITVSAVEEYKVESNGRSRYVVSGTVVDERGTRTISGLLRIVK